MTKLTHPMIKRIVAFICIIAILSFNNHSVSAYSAHLFHDIGSQYWSKDSIMSLFYRGVIEPGEDGDFHPNQPVTRYNLIKFFVKEANTPLVYSKTSDFTDVTSQSVMATIIHTAITNGVIVRRYYGLTFQPNTHATRGELALMIARTLQLNPSNDPVSVMDLHYYPQGDLIESVVDHHVMHIYKDGTFRPYKLVTKAEVAVALNNMTMIELKKDVLTKGDVIGLVKHHERAVLHLLLQLNDNQKVDNTQSFTAIEPKLRQLYSENQVERWRHIYDDQFGSLYEPAKLTPYIFSGIDALSTISSQTADRIVFTFKTPADDAGYVSAGDHIYTLINESGHWIISDYCKVPLTKPFSISEGQAIVQYDMRLQGDYHQVQYIGTYHNNNVFETIGPSLSHHYFMVGSDPQGIVDNVDYSSKSQ